MYALSAGRPLSFAPGSRHSDTRTATIPPCRASVQTFTAEPAMGTMDPLKRRAGSLYEVLKVKETASPREIKTAYRSLAKVYHPDTSESDGRDFIQIHNAYATLSDPAARALYDLTLGTHRRRPFDWARSRVYPTRRWETDQCW